MQKHPCFFKDESESYKFEETIDYFLSWTLRCADEKYTDNLLLNKYSKMILSKLLYDDESRLENKIVQNVQTWKQWANIDLCVHFTIDNQNYALIIENKMYSSIREGQLEKYMAIANNFYKNKPEFKTTFVFIRPDYEHETKFNEKGIVEKAEYKYYNLAQLQDILPSEVTGNNIFDEFWFYWK